MSETAINQLDFSREEKEKAFEWLREYGLMANVQESHHCLVLITEIINLNDEIKLSNENYTKCLKETMSEEQRESS